MKNLISLLCIALTLTLNVRAYAMQGGETDITAPIGQYGAINIQINNVGQQHHGLSLRTKCILAAACIGISGIGLLSASGFAWLYASSHQSHEIDDYCNSCGDCNTCPQCSKCSSCSGCNNCNNCSWCSQCQNCDTCTNCWDCSACSGCQQFIEDCDLYCIIGGCDPACVACAACTDCSGDCYQCPPYKCPQNVTVAP